MLANPRIYIAIATFLPWVGGAERQAFLQGQSLRKRGFDPTIITFRFDKIETSHEVMEGVPIIRVAGSLLGNRKKLPRPIQQLLYLMALFVIGWVLWRHRHNYDVLHVYQLNMLALPTALVCRLTGKPIVIVVRSVGPGKERNLFHWHSLMAGPLDATAPWLQVDNIVRQQGDLEDLKRLGKLAVRFTRSLLDRTQAVVVILSSRMKEYLDEYDFDTHTIQIIPNGVDITHFSPSRAYSHITERGQTVVCVSRLSQEKGIDMLLQAWHLVHKQLPQAKLIIVGHGPLKTQLECIAQALGIADSIEFAGLQSDIPAQLHRGSLAVLPSHWEGMPNAVLEAMACGLPCVATRVSGSEDIIQHGVNGLLVEPRDYESMAKALLILLCDPVLVKKYGNAARTRIEQYYSLEHITDLYVELYQKITTINCRQKIKKHIRRSENC